MCRRLLKGWRLIRKFRTKAVKRENMILKTLLFFVRGVALSQRLLWALYIKGVENPSSGVSYICVALWVVDLSES